MRAPGAATRGATQDRRLTAGWLDVPFLIMSNNICSHERLMNSNASYLPGYLFGGRAWLPAAGGCRRGCCLAEGAALALGGGMQRSSYRPAESWLSLMQAVEMLRLPLAFGRSSFNISLRGALATKSVQPAPAPPAPQATGRGCSVRRKTTASACCSTSTRQHDRVEERREYGCDG